MTLYDIVSSAQYMQVFSIYLTNAYDQNIPIARGTRSEMISMDVDENEEDFFNHLMCDVEYFHITDKGVMVVFVRDEHFEERASYNYSDEYVKRWDNFNPKTRPWLHGIETEEYTDKYLWKFAGYSESKDKKCSTCAYREIDGKPHAMCKSCICGDRYEQDKIEGEVTK